MRVSEIVSMEDISFNPIKVLFLLGYIYKNEKVHITFNPIKVLFLQGICQFTVSSSQNFQSYQGSIFTLNELDKFSNGEYLSILSRFYFYYNLSWSRLFLWLLSILSRFYFYSSFSISFYLYYP